MKTNAVHIREAGGPEVLELREESLEVREPGHGEVRVAVEAAGLNRADCLQRRGVYPAPAGVPSDVPGLEYAGVVEACGEGVSEWSPGDRVMGIVGGGSMAEHLVVHARECLAVPEGMSSADAAAIPEAFMTAYDAFLQGELSRGDRVLVHAVGSGIGTAAIQLARIFGATSIGTSRTADKLERCLELGLDHAVDTSEGKDFVDALRKLGGAHVVLDTIGAKYLASNLKASAPGARIVTIGLLGGVRAELDLGLLLARRISLRGSVLRSRPLEEKIELAQRFGREVLPFFAKGMLKPIVSEVMPMAQVVDAHTRMEAGDTFGKIVLHW